MYDFDKMFSDFIKSKGHVHEEDFNEVYEEWLNKETSFGMTPSEILNKMTDAQLIAELREECAVDSPSLTVMENIEKRAPIELLIPLLNESNHTLVYCAAELLRNLEAAPLEIFADLLDKTDDEELFELLIAALKENPDSVREKLLGKAANADMRIKTVIGEILAEGGRDERVFKLLSELFASGDNLPLYSSYLARYGDERAAAMLYRALDNARYGDYIEIRNAIEALGGIVDDYKDFSADLDYITIKEKSDAK